MKIAIVWFWDRASKIWFDWHDGHRAAIEQIAKTHTVDWYLDEGIPSKTSTYDFILLWGDSNCEAVGMLNGNPAKKGMILTTNPQNIENLRRLDVVYVESQPVYEEVRKYGIRTIKAMGTDTDLFKPDETKEKDIEYFYPATFSPWKRQSEIAYLGDRLLCIGTVQPDGKEELSICKRNGVDIRIGYFPADLIKDCYQRAKKVIIPAVHGSERTVLEAMACNILPQVTHPENVRTQSYLEEYQREKNDFPTLTPREFVEKYYSHYTFAKHLMEGMNA